MIAKPEYLLSLCFGPSILTRCAARWGCAECTLRVVGLLACGAVQGRQISITQASGLLGVSYTSGAAAVHQARALGWIEARHQRHQRLRLTLEGLRIAGLLERAEREARVQVQRAELPKWPRAYVRKKVSATAL